MSSDGTAARRKPLTAGGAKLVRLAGAASVTVALVLVGLKLWAFVATGSIAMLGTLADSGLDLLASLMTLGAVRFALQPADREHRFGHGKLEAIAGLAQSFVILASAAYVASEAVRRLITPAAVEAPAAGVLVMLVSIGLTVVLVLFQRHVVTTTGSIAISADSMHYRADLLGNLAVLLAIVLSSWLGWHRADPVLGLVVVLIIIASVRSIVTQSLDVLLDRELSGDDRDAIKAIAREHVDVLGVHDLRTRTSGTHDFIQFHLELPPGMTLARAHEICDAVQRDVRAAFPRAEVMIHADPYGIDEPQDDF